MNWIEEYNPEMEVYECIDFIRGDLNGDGMQDIAFVMDNGTIYKDKEGLDNCMFDNRCMHILLQQQDGSFKELDEAPFLNDRYSGGMRGDPYYGAYMEAGCLMLRLGWGSSSGTVQIERYTYSDGNLQRVQTTSVNDYAYADGNDVEVEYEQTDTWKRYAVAMDGYRMVRVNLADSEHPEHKAFPQVSLFDTSFYIYNNKIQTITESSRALDIACTAFAEEGAHDVVQKGLPYTDWQKDGYELLKGVSLPDYYYVFSDTQKEEKDEAKGWSGDYIYYNGITKDDQVLYHEVYVCQENEKKTILVEDATGRIKETK